MTKYFDGTLPLPFHQITAVATQLNAQDLVTLLGNRQAVSILLRLEDFPETCVGYVFNIRRQGTAFDLLNICGEVELTAASIESLLIIMRHVCGVEYSESAQSWLHACQNDFGRTEQLGQFRS